MALAIIEPAEPGAGGPRFRIDIGSNAYYSYSIGGRETVRSNGLTVLAEPTFTSGLAGPLPPSQRGRGFLDVPLERFDRKHRSIQLASFRTKDRSGPAISDVVSLPLGDPGYPDVPPPALFERFPGERARALCLAQSEDCMTTATQSVPYSYQRSQDYSSALFLDALTSLLPKVLPSIGSVLGGLFGGSGGGGGGNGNAAPNPLAALGNPETIKAITDLIQQISKAKSVERGVLYTDHAAHRAASLALSTYRREFSDAMVAPALLAALPALMPMLEKVLNPETLKAIMENVSPSKLIGTVSDAVGNFAKLGMEDNKQLQEHLERLNPGVKNEELMKLLEGLSTGEARAGSKLNYKRVESVKLSLLDTTPQTIYGRSRLAYHYGRDLSFPLAVETPRPIAQGTLEITLKEAATLKVLYEKRLRVADVANGPLATVPVVPWSALSRLRAGDDYLLGLALSWPGARGGPRRGTAVSQLVTLVRDYAFDRIEESSPSLVPLADATRDRDFWHRIWDRAFEARGLTRVRLACSYCYVLESERTSNVRMETKSKLEESAETKRHEGKLKSGMILSPDALSRLIPRLSGNRRPALSEAQLAALRTPDFVDRFNQEAKTEVEFKGRRGESAALWAYPELKLCEVVLKRVAKVNEHGHIEGLDEETVTFPLPAIVHFVGASSAEDAGTGGELDGLKLAFDQKVGLHPANLERRPAAPLRARASALTRRRSLAGGRHGRW
jgi:hypothetical protein